MMSPGFLEPVNGGRNLPYNPRPVEGKRDFNRDFHSRCSYCWRLDMKRFPLAGIPHNGKFRKFVVPGKSCLKPKAATAAIRAQGSVGAPSVQQGAAQTQGLCAAFAVLYW